MAIKKPKARFEEDENDWMFSYADMVTLLFTFFVLLYSISNPDPVKMQLISSYFSKDQKMTFTELQQKIEEYIVDNEVEQQVAVKLTSKGVEINFKDKVLFDPGQAELKNVAYSILSEIGKMLNYEEISDRKISVEGHTDSIPMRSNLYPSNWELSSARAANVVRYLVSQDLNYKRFESIGYADTRPIVPENESKRGLAQNRRVVVVISPESYMADIARTGIEINSPSGNKKKDKPITPVRSKIASVKEKEKIKKEIKKTALPEKDKEKMREYFMTAQAEFKKGNFDKALSFWEKVLEIDPEHKESTAYIKRTRSKVAK